MSALYEMDLDDRRCRSRAIISTLAEFPAKGPWPVVNTSSTPSRFRRLTDGLERAVLNSEHATPEPVRVKELWIPVGIYLLSRLYVISMFLALSKILHRTLTFVLTPWDSQWYLSIAENGYVHSIPPGVGNAAQSNLGFFPLMPLAVRLVHTLAPLSWKTSGLTAAFLTGLTASLAVWFMLRDSGTLSESRRGISLVFFTPGALVLSFVYSEGLIVTFACLTIWALRREKWLFAGLAAAVCSLADPVGCAAVFTCVVIALLAIYREKTWRPLVAIVVAPLGVLSFFTYLSFHAGSFFTWFHAQRRGWQGGHYFNGAPNAIYSFIAHGFSNLNPPVKTMSLLLAVIMLVLFARIRPHLSVVVYVVTVIFMGLLSPIIGITPRLLLRDSPLLATVGSRLNRRWFGVILAGSCAILGFLIIVSTPWTWTP